MILFCSVATTMQKKNTRKKRKRKKTHNQSTINIKSDIRMQLQPLTQASLHATDAYLNINLNTRDLPPSDARINVCTYIV